jgi:hypothetical protein
MNDADRTKLARFLGMTGSAHDGESLNAIRMANRLIGGLGITWEEALAGDNGYSEEFVKQVAARSYQEGLKDGQTQAPGAPRKTFAGYAALLLKKHRDNLSDWEVGFLESWQHKSYPPSDRQLAIFDRLQDKTGEQRPTTWGDVDG